MSDCLNVALVTGVFKWIPTRPICVWPLGAVSVVIMRDWLFTVGCFNSLQYCRVHTGMISAAAAGGGWMGAEWPPGSP